MLEQPGLHYAAVLGAPIEHSKSPDIHRAAYQYLDLPIDYGRFEITEDTADEFMTTLDERFGNRSVLAGFSVTMPLKSVMVPHMDAIDERVQTLGVLNTIVFDEHGAATGYNTDVDGVRHALQRAGATPTDGGSMAVLGAGGTATAAVAAAADMGLHDVVLYVRNAKRAEPAAQVASTLGLTSSIRPLSKFPVEVVEHDAVVATLPAFAADAFASQLPHLGLPPLLDVIYEPWPTKLASAWRLRGAPIASGLDMLLYQGVEQAKLFSKKLLVDDAPIDWDQATIRMAAALGLTVK